jgi:hypothetical protein
MGIIEKPESRISELSARKYINVLNKGNRNNENLPI